MRLTRPGKDIDIILAYVVGALIILVIFWVIAAEIL